MLAEGRHGRRRGGLEALFRGDSGLVLTFALGLWFAGVMTVLVMAVGTGVTVAALSLSALGLRASCLRPRGLGVARRTRSRLPRLSRRRLDRLYGRDAPLGGA